jgi:hypothetical protein
MSHTPGPWRVATKSNIGNMVEAESGNGYRCVATFQECGPSPRFDVQQANREANGRLIAAAPDLLEACKAVLATGFERDFLRAAIAKAEAA